MFQSTLVLALAAFAAASPLEQRQATTKATSGVSTVPTMTPYSSQPSSDMLSGWNKQFEIHSSCNATQRNQLEGGLNEMVQLAASARDHILRWGNSSTLYNRYFGNAITAEPLGWFTKIIDADKTGALFRCDDADDNCATQDSWAGHWRGSNATEETVICDLSFHIRWSLDAMCSRGYTVAGWPTNTYWASDLMHRVFHVPTVSEGVVEHFSEDYAAMVENADVNPAENARDSDVLQYFALEAYAFDVAVPGTGCTGEFVPEEDEEVVESTSSSSAGATTARTTMTTAASARQTATRTTSADDSCHTHSDGVVHCT